MRLQITCGNCKFAHNLLGLSAQDVDILDIMVAG